MPLFFDAIFSSVILGHFVIDILNGTRTVLLTYLSGPLKLSNTDIGLISTSYIMAGSLSQPVFGYFIDRLGARWIASGGLLWMASFFSLALITPGSLSIWLFVIASLGSGAFHPAGTMLATLSGRNHLDGGETTSTATFFFFGYAGAFVGPLLAGPILEKFGPFGLLFLTVFSVPVGVNTAYQLRLLLPRKLAGLADPAKVQADPPAESSFPGMVPFLALILMAAGQAWVQQNLTTFIPKYLSDMGINPTVYGLMTALFMGGSAVGNGVGGMLADRFGKQRLAILSLSFSAIPILIIGLLKWSFWLYFLIPLAGLLIGLVYSSIIILAQRLIPGKLALASGVILGFMFSCGALGSALSGLLADRWGFSLVFYMTAGLSLLAGCLALWVRDTRAHV